MEGFTVSNAQRYIDSGSNSVEFNSQRFNEPGISGSEETSNKSFADTLKEAVNTVNQLEKDTDKKMQDLATGKNNNVADVMIAAEKAEIALKLMIQVRGKIIDAYQEVMKMQV